MIPVIHLGDGLEGLRGIPGKAGLILSDLPSGETHAELDVVPDLPALWAAIWTALRPNGIAVLMASSIRFAMALIASESKAFRYDLVWSKSVATGFLNAAHRPLRAHEFVLVFWRGRNATYHAQMEETLDPITASAQRSGPGENYRGRVMRPIQSNGRDGDRGSVNYDTKGKRNGRGCARTGATDRFPRSVLAFGSVPSRAPERTHHQQKPEDLLRNLIRQYSDLDDLVVDPFAGSGSAGRAALAEGRRFVGWDLSPRFANDWCAS